MLTRDEYIHLRNILEDRINEQCGLFFELTDGPNTGCIESVVETLFASISQNVGILAKLCDGISSDSMYEQSLAGAPLQSQAGMAQYENRCETGQARPKNALCPVFCSRFLMSF